MTITLRKSIGGRWEWKVRLPRYTVWGWTRTREQVLDQALWTLHRALS